ncbi:hypothetical protein HBA55_29705 [Pseudomaricurvus alkylphenolicus]|uniref:phage adaptor protein n=1 Tax=Pseudomaricurvus alkylphenolicus TaxID=1306991 RepID=UPI00142302FD|nr:hypothetical protein [Pseudomaricurvus alkylphenolicus]NIB43815.1 hypothetical protein [Pseudomaricurvus alkylphenolicus]
MTYIDWDAFQQIYRVSNNSTGAPSHITIDPSDNIVLGPTPSDVYVITGEFHRGAQVLAAGGDTPEMPSDYHMLIVYAAMEDLGFYDVAEEVLARSQKKAKRLRRQLKRTQLPKMKKAGPLA